MTDGISRTRRASRTGRTKRYISLATMVVALVVAIDQWGLRANSFAGLPGGQSTMDVQVPGVSNADTSMIQGPTGADCTFLRNPEKFREAAANYRTQVSERTQLVAAKLMRGDRSLLRAQDIPQKNFIDTILFARMKKDNVQSAPLCTDEEYIRRVTLDLTGRIPASEDVTRFVADNNPGKRDALVDSLVGTPEFVDKWTMFYGDLFKNTSRSVNIQRFPGGRDAFYKYIKDAIARNKSYTQIATELIAGQGDSYVNGEVNFTVGGFVPMGPIQDVYDGQAVETSSAFLGLSSMDCLLCHNGAGHLDSVNLWASKHLRSEAWGMSAFFARTQLQRQVVQQQPRIDKWLVTDRNNGEYQLNTTTGNRSARQPLTGGSGTVPAKYMFGGAVPNPGENRRQALARFVTADPQFARAGVNYIWEKLMVEALVAPSNAFDPMRLDSKSPPPAPWTLQPDNPDLLDALSQEFIRGGFSIQNIITLIAKSNAYQLSSQYPGAWKIDYVPYFARKYVRRLDAEEIHDAIAKATGILNSYVIDDALGTVNWAMQLPEPFEPRNGQNAALGRVFLDSFLRGDRDQKLRTDEGSILQSLNLMNSAYVLNRIHMNNAGSTVSKLVTPTNLPALTPAQIITSLYLSSLSRNPTAAEMQTLTPYFTSLSRQQAAESIQWVLLNKVDFIFNY